MSKQTLLNSLTSTPSYIRVLHVLLTLFYAALHRTSELNEYKVFGV